MYEEQTQSEVALPAFIKITPEYKMARSDGTVEIRVLGYN